ncbi:MAG: hypothetical protein ACLR5H_09620 [Oscillospiraceae bacterium]
MVGKLLGGGLVLLGTALWCRGEIQARRRETDRAADAGGGPGGDGGGDPQPAAAHAPAAGAAGPAGPVRRVLCPGALGPGRGQPLQDAWEDGFRELTPPEAAGILRDTELTGDEERIVSALTAAVHRLEELADRRRRDSRQRERLLWAAALSGAGLFIILLI